MFIIKKSNYPNNSNIDKYIKSHIPALYFLKEEQFENEDLLIDNLTKYFSEQYHFKNQYKEMTADFKKQIIINYTTVKQLLSDIEPQYIENAIDELWEGLQEDMIYGKYNKNGIINF